MFLRVIFHISVSLYYLYETLKHTAEVIVLSWSL